MTAGSALFAIYLEVRRARGVFALSRWLEEERPEQWHRAHHGGNVEDSIEKLRRGALRNDTDLAERHEAATQRGKAMVVTVVVFGLAVTALLVDLVN